MSRNSVLDEFNVNRLAVIQEDVAEHFEDEQQMSQSGWGLVRSLLTLITCLLLSPMVK